MELSYFHLTNSLDKKKEKGSFKGMTDFLVQEKSTQESHWILFTVITLRDLI